MVASSLKRCKMGATLAFVFVLCACVKASSSAPSSDISFSERTPITFLDTAFNVTDIFHKAGEYYWTTAARCGGSDKGFVGSVGTKLNALLKGESFVHFIGKAYTLCFRPDAQEGWIESAAPFVNFVNPKIATLLIATVGGMLYASRHDGTATRLFSLFAPIPLVCGVLLVDAFSRHPSYTILALIALGSLVFSMRPTPWRLTVIAMAAFWAYLTLELYLIGDAIVEKQKADARYDSERLGHLVLSARDLRWRSRLDAVGDFGWTWVNNAIQYAGPAAIACSFLVCQKSLGWYTILAVYTVVFSSFCTNYSDAGLWMTFSIPAISMLVNCIVSPDPVPTPHGPITTTSEVKEIIEEHMPPSVHTSVPEADPHSDVYAARYAAQVQARAEQQQAAAARQQQQQYTPKVPVVIPQAGTSRQTVGSVLGTDIAPISREPVHHTGVSTHTATAGVTTTVTRETVVVHVTPATTATAATAAQASAGGDASNKRKLEGAEENPSKRHHS